MQARNFFKPQLNHPVSQQTNLDNAIEKRIKRITQTFPKQSDLEARRKSPVKPFENHIITRLLLQEWMDTAGDIDDNLQNYLNSIKTDPAHPVSYEILYRCVKILLHATNPIQFLAHPIIKKLSGQSFLSQALLILYEYHLLNRDNFIILLTMSHSDLFKLCKILDENDTFNQLRFPENQIIRKILPYSQPYLHDLTIMLDWCTAFSTRQDLKNILALKPSQMKELHKHMVVFLENKQTSTIPIRVCCLKIAEKLDEGLTHMLNYPSFDLDATMEVVRAGANPNMTDDDGNTILHKITEKLVTSLNPHICMTIIRELVQVWRANITVRNNHNVHPWEIFLGERNPNHIECAIEFLQLGFTFNEMTWLDMNSTANSSYIDMLIEHQARDPLAQKLLNILMNQFESTLKHNGINPAGYIDRQTIIKEKPIGQGAYSDVHRGIWKGTHIAMKYLPLHQFDNFANEMRWLQLLNGLNAPHIIRLHGYYMNIYTNSLYIFLEFATRGALDTIYYEENIWQLNLRMQLIQQLVEGLFWIHQNKLVHGDLKSANVLVDDKNAVKIIDFGYSDNAGAHHRPVGTSIYMAPELLNSPKQGNTYATDIFSLGYTLCEIIGWESIIDSMQLDDDYTNEQLAVDVINGLRPPISPTCPKELTTLICQTWKKDPADRLSIEQLQVEVQAKCGIP